MQDLTRSYIAEPCKVGAWTMITTTQASGLGVTAADLQSRQP